MVGRRLPLIAALAWLAAFTGPLPADSEVVSPDSIPGTTKVDAEGVLELADKNPGLVIVDARIRQDRLQGYIEGSVSLPDVDTNCESLKAAGSVCSVWPPTAFMLPPTVTRVSPDTV